MTTNPPAATATGGRAQPGHGRPLAAAAGQPTSEGASSLGNQSSAASSGAEALPDTSSLGIMAFIPVSLNVIRNTESLLFGLYVKQKDRGFVPFRSQSTPLLDHHRQQLLAEGTQVYIDVRQHEAYCQYIESQLDSVLANKSIDVVERARLLYQVADRLVERMAHGLTVDHMAQVRKLIRILVSHTLHSRELPDAMQGVIAEEHHPGGHMLHVSAGMLRLGLAMKLPMQQMGELALAGMLHDVGIPADVFAMAESELCEQIEPDVYRTHPTVGEERVRAIYPEATGVLAVIAQHHERPDGTGFPNKLSGEGIHPWARICAVVEAYDHRLVGRPGETPLPPEEALKAMATEAGKRFDAKVFETFAKQISAERKLAGATAEGGGAAPLPFAGACGPAGRNRRREPRYPFHVALTIQREARAAGKGGGTHVVRSLDISRSGIHFISKHPLGVPEDVLIDMPVDSGNVLGATKAVRARVVRCQRSQFDDGYDIGATFIIPGGGHGGAH